MNEETKWSPGEWTANGVNVRIMNSQRVPIDRAFFYFQGGYTDEPGKATTKEELEANAKLCATASKLYAVVERMRRRAETGGPIRTGDVRAMDKVMAEARGESTEIMFYKPRDYGDKMTTAEFLEDVESGCFIDYDGHGYFGTDTQESDQMVIPSETKEDSFFLPEWATHIYWYNR